MAVRLEEENEQLLKEKVSSFHFSCLDRIILVLLFYAEFLGF